MHPQLEDITGISKIHADKLGKVQATYMKYEGMDATDYPPALKEIINLMIVCNKPNPIFEISN